MGYRGLAPIWVAGTISQEQPVELQLIEVIVPGHTHHLYATPDETTNDVRLDSAIDEHHAGE